MNNTPTVTPYKKGGVLSLVIGHCWVFFFARWDWYTSNPAFLPHVASLLVFSSP